MAASFLFRSLSSRIRPHKHRLAAVLSFNHLFTTTAEEKLNLKESQRNSPSVSKLLQIFDKTSSSPSEVKRRTVLVREILHSKRYKDGERLSAEDQKFVMENLLRYHPNAEDKIGCGVDYIMVDRHSYYKFSRCLILVRVDGEFIDFSYKKCLRQYKLGEKFIHQEQPLPEEEVESRKSFIHQEQALPEEEVGSRKSFWSYFW